MVNSCYIGDVRDGLRSFMASGVRAQTCVTSPPYWGLRDYGVAGQIGLEPTIAEYVATMVDVFRLVRDVLADDGTLWLNLGDCYHNGDKGGGYQCSRVTAEDSLQAGNLASDFVGAPNRQPQYGLKPKDLVGMPWRVAFALQADGWYLRSDVIWAKLNPMPESVTDRPTKAHEYLFLLSKSERYFYDTDAIKEPASDGTHERRSVKMPDGWATHDGGHGSFHRDGREKGATRKFAEPGSGTKNNSSFDAAMAVMPSMRNKRSVWSLATEAFPEAHFATFPTALVEPCILAGSRPGDIVLDPFMGSGTVAQVAQSLGRRWIGCELNRAYVEMQKRRAAQMGMELTA